MKILTIIIAVFSLFFFTGFNAGISPPLTDSFLCHRPGEYLTTGAISILETYKKVLSKKPVCLITATDTSFSVASTMPANQYVIFTNAYAGKLVSYAAYFSTLAKDNLGTIWDSDPKSYAYYQACAPNPILFPYPYDNGIHNLDVYVAKFVPVETFKKTTLTGNWVYKDTPSGINLKDIKTIRDYYLESKSGFINTTYPSRYASKFATLGIICDVRLKSNKVIPCYLIGYEISNDPTQWVLWKK